jgi:anti-sigma28 factor (negative regulator of flagellin synthesis)
MNIEQIKGNRYTPLKAGKGDSSSKANEAKSHSKSAGSSGKNQNATNVSLSDSIFDGEISFAKNALSNIRHNSLNSLKEIKQKIDEGAYDSEKVHQEISSLVEKDLPNLTNIFPHSTDAGNAPPTISGDHKKRLLQNPEVLKKVSENIAKELQHISL